jgi:hypothetical protein
MRSISLLQYVLIIGINTFLLIPVLFFPLLIIPLHFLLCFVSYNYLFNLKQFSTLWDKNVFAAVSTIVQAFIASLIISVTSDEIFIGIFHFILLFLYFFGISCIEFFIIRWQFEKFTNKKQH